MMTGAKDSPCDHENMWRISFIKGEEQKYINRKLWVIEDTCGSHVPTWDHLCPHIIEEPEFSRCQDYPIPNAISN